MPNLIELPKLPTVQKRSCILITDSTWKQLLDYMSELANCVNTMSADIESLKSQTSKNTAAITTLANTLKEIYENA